jgi:hypothetical protein
LETFRALPLGPEGDLFLAVVLHQPDPRLVVCHLHWQNVEYHVFSVIVITAQKNVK